MAARSAPESGDVIVREAHHDGEFRYLLSTVGFANQISIVDYTGAVRHALAYAESQHVKAWIVVDGGEPVPISDQLRWTAPRPAGPDVLERLRGEFLEMPGLQLTVTQVRRLCGIDPAACQTMLDALVEAKFLCRTVDGRYVRRAADAEAPLSLV